MFLKYYFFTQATQTKKIAKELAYSTMD